MKVIELFAGIGSQALALKNIGIEVESIVSEIDKFAYNSYCAIHGDTMNLGDVRKIAHLPQCDLLTYSFPCQDLSNAGLRKGMSKDSGTRSALLWEVGRLLDDAKVRGCLPDFLLMENVDAILNKRNIVEFNHWISFLTDLGYTSEYKILNAKDFGVPQNRKRCFMVSTLDGRKFVFPEGVPLETRLCDVLEDDVNESFYLSDDKVSKYKAYEKRQKNDAIIVAGTLASKGGYKQTAKVYSDMGIAPTMVTSGGGGHIPKIEITGEIVGTKFEQVNRVYGVNGISPTIMAKSGDGHTPKIESIEDKCYKGVVNKNIRIRYLTPKECWRLMGFPDSAYEAAKDIPTSKTQLYNQAGNSIVVPCLEAIFKAMFIEKTWKNN